MPKHTFQTYKDILQTTCSHLNEYTSQTLRATGIILVPNESQGMGDVSSGVKNSVNGTQPPLGD